MGKHKFRDLIPIIISFLIGVIVISFLNLRDVQEEITIKAKFDYLTRITKKGDEKLRDHHGIVEGLQVNLYSRKIITDKQRALFQMQCVKEFSNAGMDPNRLTRILQECEDDLVDLQLHGMQKLDSEGLAQWDIDINLNENRHYDITILAKTKFATITISRIFIISSPFTSPINPISRITYSICASLS